MSETVPTERERRDDAFRTGFRVGFTFGREVGFGEGVGAMRRVLAKIMERRRRG